MTEPRGELVNPFPGPQPYRPSDRDRFYGREVVGHELASTILAHRCVALFGPSGAGKSSVMQAAVIPELDSDFDFRHVTIDGWPADEEPVAWLLYTLHAQLKLSPPGGELGLYESVEWTVRQAFRRSDRPILIYLDQIEQLLMPHRSAASVEAFLDWLDRFAERPIRGLHLVLAMREDYLGRFRDRARGRHRLLENGFRLGPLTVGEIVGAVCHAAADGTPAQTWAPAAMRPLMLQVRMPGTSESDSAEVQTAFAQIVCRALFVERAEQGGAVAVAGSVLAEPILHRYLESTLEGLGPLRGPAERLLEDLLVAADGTRSLLTEEAARASGLLPGADLDTVLTRLEQAAILRAEQHRGTRYFEIGHDWLAKWVFDRKQERLARAAELALQREQAEKQRVVEAQLRLARAETRRARRGIAIVAALGVLALVLGVHAWTQQEVARSEAEKARAAEIEARAERDRANLASDAATAAREKAEASLAAEQRAREAARIAAAEALSQQQIAEEQRTVAEQQRAAAESSEVKAKTALVGQRRATREAEHQRGQAEQNLTRAEAEARRARDANHLAVALSVLADDPTSALALLLEVEDPVRTQGWTPATVEALQRPTSQRVIRGHEGYVVVARFSPDGALVATASHDHSAQISRVDGTAAQLRLAHGDEVVDLAFSPDGKQVATASADGSARLWPQGGSGTPRVLAGSGAALVALAFSPDGKHLATAARDGSARVFAVAGAAPPRVLAGHTAAARSLAFSPDSQRLVTTADDATARVWSLAGSTAPVVLRGHEGSVYAASFSADSQRVVTAGDDRSARVWRLAGAKPGELAAERVLLGHTDAVYAAEFSPTGDRIVTASRDRTARVWTLATGGEAKARILRGHSDKVYLARFDPRGQSVATVSRDGTARIWPVGKAGDPRILRGHSGPVVGVEFSRDGRRIVTAAEDGTARVWDVDDAHGERVLRGHTGAVRSAHFSADGGRIVTAASDRSARVWSLTGPRAALLANLAGHDGEVLSALLAPDPARVFTGASDGKFRVWALGAGKASARSERSVDLELTGRPEFVTVRADGRRVLTTATDVVTLLNLDSNTRTELRGHSGKVRHAAFSPDGARVVTVADDRSVRIWSASGGPATQVLRGHEGSVYYGAFSPDGAHVVTASWDRTARIWSADGNTPAVVLAGHQQAVRSAEFSADGTRVVTGSDDGTAKIWRSDGNGDVVTLHGHEGKVLHASFSPDDHHVVTASSDHTARVWASDFDNPELLRTKIRETTTVCLVPRQRELLLGEAPADARARHQACEAGFGR